MTKLKKYNEVVTALYRTSALVWVWVKLANDPIIVDLIINALV